jgi:DNA modification methylase
MAKCAKRAATTAREPFPDIQQLLGSQLVVWRNLHDLRPYPGNARKHPPKQIHALARTIRQQGWTSPILVDENRTILVGHGRLESAKILNLPQVPTLTLSGLSESKKRAIVIADNRLAERAEWDMDVLRGQFRELIAVDFEVDLTGFTTGEVDLILDGSQDSKSPADADDIFDSEENRPAISRPGDLWQLGDNRLYCGDARLRQSYLHLFGSEQAQMVVTDPPYNVKIHGHARGRGKRFREFAMASGEMTDAQFATFLRTCMRCAAAFSDQGAIHYWFSDWRHLPAFFQAGFPLFGDLKQLLVWNKTNAGQGNFYRSKHELVLVFKNGDEAHINNFGLGAEGRYRSNVLDYPGGATPGEARRAEMDLHPTVKPVALIADLIRDCSKRNGIILDPFCGSGTVLLAAERTGRKARAIEIDPLYVDVAIRRWQDKTGGTARRAEDGRSFAELDHIGDAPSQDTGITKPAAHSLRRKR